MIFGLDYWPIDFLYVSVGVIVTLWLMMEKEFTNNDAQRSRI